MAGYGVGASLASIGTGQRHQATQMLGEAAKEEGQRNIANEQLAAQEKAGRQQLLSSVGSTVGFAAGAQMGAVGGPWGALLGGALGAIAGGWGS